MSVTSIPLIVIASISFYVGVYHLVIYIRRKQSRQDLTFALMCFANGFYDIFCAGLYNATSVSVGVQWQRLQLMALALIDTAFLWFVVDYTHHKPRKLTYLFSIYFIFASIVQAVDRSDLTWLVDQPSIKEILLPFGGMRVIYYETTIGLFTTIQGLMGLVVGIYILWQAFRFYQHGNKQEATPLLIALGLMFATAINDTVISNGLYQFVYTIEYGFIAMILLMTYILSNTIVQASKTEKSLIESEERFRTIVENSHAGIVTINNNFQFAYVNDRLFQISGYTREEMLGKDFRWFLDSESKQKVAEMYIRRQKGEAVTPRYELSIIRKDGNKRMLEMSSATTVLSTGEVQTIGQLLDITERKQAEEALRQAYLVVENSPAILFRWRASENWPIEMVSKNIAQFGYTPEELLSNRIPFSSLVHPQDLERVKHEVQEYSTSGADNFKQEYRMVTSKGETRWVDDRTAIVRDDAGRITHYQGIVIDITERKFAEAALQESEAKYRSLFETSPESITVLDLTGVIVDCNEASEKMRGEPRDQLIGKSFMEIGVLNENDLTKYFQLFTEILDGNTSASMEIESLRPDGQPRWVEVFPVLLKKDGDAYALQIISRDISQRKVAEAERENLIKELETRNAELERFTYIVSHDLRSPLVTIRGFLGYLDKNVSLGKTDQVKEDMGRIATATNKMQRMLNELLELSRIGRMMNPYENIDFSQLVHEAVDLVRIPIEARGIQVNIAENLLYVYGDRARLLDVVHNLLENACKYMGDQPDPIIDIGLRRTDPDDELIYFIRDNGIGIDPQYHTRIFGLFNKLDIHTDGTGVGLALVKRIIEEHGGRIWVESEGKGAGSTFCFTLPPNPEKRAID